MFKDWIAEGGAAQKRIEAMDRDAMLSIKTEPQLQGSVPLSVWWTRQDMILVIYLLRGILSASVTIATILIILLVVTIYGTFVR